MSVLGKCKPRTTVSGRKMSLPFSWKLPKRAKVKTILNALACRLSAVGVAVTLGRFLCSQTKLDNFSRMRLSSRLWRFPKTRRQVKLDHFCHDNLRNRSNSNSPTTPFASQRMEWHRPSLHKAPYTQRMSSSTDFLPTIAPEQSCT
jgi:hypothetical protein